MTGMRDKPLRRFGLLVLPLLILLNIVTLPVHAAAEQNDYSDAVWRNGKYSSSLGDMAGRQLYVYGIVDSSAEVGENGTDLDIKLNSDAAAGRLDTALYLYRIFGNKPENACPFSDVPETYAEAVAWLFEAGVTKGIGNNLYGIGSITEYQLLVMLSRFFGWGTEDSGELYCTADDLSLLPLGPKSEAFTSGELYQILTAVIERLAPEKAVPIRSEMSIPDSISLTADSYQDAARQIRKALQYLPYKISLQFTEQCPQEDIKLFATHYAKYYGEPSSQIISAVNRSYVSPYYLYAYSGGRFNLWFRFYSDAYMASADALDWLRVYEDASYSAALRDFEAQYLSPLKANVSGYDRIVDAHDLLCSLAAYDYDAYYNNNRPEAHKLLGFMENGQIECDGYVKALQWMLCYLGIDSYEVIGNEESGLHAWSKVLLDGIWYNVDACWDDGVSSHEYFMKSDSYFEQHQHSFSDGFSTEAFSSIINY